MRLVNKNTGELLLIKYDPIERQRRRVARMRVAVWAAISCIARNDPPQACTSVMLTLTYAEVDGWGARDIRQAVRWARGVGCKGYVWVAELQKRGAVHYHLLVQWPSEKPWIKPNESNGAWGKGFTWVTPDVKSPWYLLKYIQKGISDEERNVYPKGLRLYGVSQYLVRRMDFTERLAYRGLQLPAWYRQGKEDTAIVLGSYRVGGGIDYRGAIEPCPFVEYPLHAVDKVRVREYDTSDTYMDVSQG